MAALGGGGSNKWTRACIDRRWPALVTHVFHHNVGGEREPALPKQEQVSKLARTESLEAIAPEQQR